MTHGGFRIEMSVRDYELDMEGVVNNAVYQNYLEHARHEYLKSMGIDFAAMVENKIHMVLTRIELDFKWPLTSGDRFVVELKPYRVSPVRIGFHQNIYRLPDHKLILRALAIGTAINKNGRPSLPKELQKMLHDF
ncbi:MAG TPA: thioesterase family protein [Deltaproteobacteria bacterium]|nr:thioesterase family protein [Deltaproteobacteria bacterium]HQB39333.1 thioesterase family protein [Deltaproteobacteria bacterium]